MKLKEIVIPLLTGAFGLTNASAEELVVVSWGGAYTASQQNAYHEPYMARNPGITIVNVDSAGESIAKINAMSKAGGVTWDLIDMVPKDAARLCDEGLLEEIDHDEVLAAAPDGTPASEDFGEFIVSPCFVPQIVYSTTFGYRTDLVGDTAPTSIADIFDIDTFPGKRALERTPIGNLEWALIADGVSSDEVYEILETEEGVIRAFSKLATLEDNIIWWDNGSQTPQLLADGEVVMGSGYNGRLFSVIEEERQPVAMLWDAQIIDLDGWVIPKGAPNKDAALKFLNFATDTPAASGSNKIHFLWSCPNIIYGIGRNTLNFGN